MSPLLWMLVAGSKHTFLAVVVQLQSHGNPKTLSFFEKNSRLGLYKKVRLQNKHLQSARNQKQGTHSQRNNHFPKFAKNLPILHGKVTELFFWVFFIFCEKHIFKATNARNSQNFRFLAVLEGMGGGSRTQKFVQQKGPGKFTFTQFYVSR